MKEYKSTPNNKKPMFKDVDQAAAHFEKKHGGNFKDPDQMESAFVNSDYRVRGEIHRRGTHSDREGRLKLYAKDKAGLKHYRNKMAKKMK